MKTGSLSKAFITIMAQGNGFHEAKWMYPFSIQGFKT